MGMSAYLSLTGRDSIQGKTTVESGLSAVGGGQAWLRITRGADAIAIYFDKLEDLGKLATELTTLEMTAREAWQGNQEGTKA